MEDMDIVKEIIGLVLGSQSDIKTQVVYGDDLYEEALRICENPVYLDYLKGLPQSVKADLKAANSAYVLPKDLQSRHFILISNHQREDGYSHYSTIAQEAVHIKNHTAFCRKYCDGDINRIAEHPNNREFRIWDEFDARRTSHRLYLTLILQQMAGYSPAEVSDLLRERELTERLQEVNGLLTEKNSVDLYVRIASILGMFYVWEMGYELSVVPRMNTWIYTLYQALTKYPSIQQVSFEDLRMEIQQLWGQRK